MADIDRTDVATLIAEEYSNTLLTSAAASSAAMQAFGTVNMGTSTTHMPVLATLPTATWVSETGTKGTTEVTWEDRTLVAEEVATIVPIHEHMVDDASVAILDDIAKLAGAAVGKTLDEAVFFGVNKPVSWASDDLLAAATAGSQLFAVVDGNANAADLWGSINQAAAALAEAGYMPTSLITSVGLRYRMANIRNGDGNLAFQGDNFAGFNTTFSANGAWDGASAEAFVVDSSRVKIGLRQDITVKFLDQATVGTINLAERDMVALRIKARFAYVLGNGATAKGEDMMPVAAVTPAAGS